MTVDIKIAEDIQILKDGRKMERGIELNTAGLRKGMKDKEDLDLIFVFFF